MSPGHPLRVANDILHGVLARVRDARQEVVLPSALRHLDQALGLLYAAEELIDMATVEQKQKQKE